MIFLRLLIFEQCSNNYSLVQKLCIKKNFGIFLNKCINSIQNRKLDTRNTEITDFIAHRQPIYNGVNALKYLIK